MCINLLRCAVTTHINIYIIYLSQMKNSLTPRFSLRICPFPTTNTFLQDTAPSTSFSLIHTVKGTSASASSAHGNLTVHYFLENGFNTVPPLIRLSPPFSLKVSFEYLSRTLASFFKTTIFFSYVCDSSFSLVQLLVLHMQVLCEVSPLDLLFSLRDSASMIQPTPNDSGSVSADPASKPVSFSWLPPRFQVSISNC